MSQSTPQSDDQSSPLRVDLSGRRALVTGAGTRVGRSIALALAKQGMDLVVHYHHNQRGAEATCEASRQLGVQATPLAADLADGQQARELVQRSLGQLGGLDLLVPSAANFERIPYPDLDDAAWDRSLDLNAKAAFSLAHEATAALRQTRGCIVFITCASTVVPFKNHLPYVVSKAATLQLMKVLSLELAPDVRVNAVAPGTVLPPDDMPESVQTSLRSSIPLQRFGSAEDIAEAVVFLARSPFVTGQQLAVDGGRSVAAVERFG